MVKTMKSSSRSVSKAGDILQFITYCSLLFSIYSVILIGYSYMLSD